MFNWFTEWVRTMNESVLWKVEPGPILKEWLPQKVSNVTREVINNYNILSAEEFFLKYQATKTTYRRRVMMYGDPYLNSPLTNLLRK